MKSPEQQMHYSSTTAKWFVQMRFVVLLFFARACNVKPVPLLQVVPMLPHPNLKIKKGQQNCWPFN
jgi:hypothetical protein